MNDNMDIDTFIGILLDEDPRLGPAIASGTQWVQDTFYPLQCTDQIGVTQNDI